MADLNQMKEGIEKGLGLDFCHERILFLIEDFEKRVRGPICCFYIADGMIGCSRGEIPIDDAESYGEKLCKACVDDARRLLECLNQPA